ncbi:hypothetical protein MSG28_009764 [Choristoneura fumiferana]|uniref:Uncharacterized protein n=1 Tax=Choristoneura fumiferana TaxID=7141 RepID=A0ACC0JCF5_CHOFU|nr:hypothetical protein MSG28_009764 [Choristoneura fumiferana]
MSIIGTVYEDVTTDVLGQMGAWQWMVTIVSTALMTSTMFIQFEDMFLLKYTSDIVCIPPNGYECSKTSACHIISINNSEQLQCNTWNVRLMGMVWIRKNWVITCDHDGNLLSTAMVCRLGVMFGYVGYGLIADCFGRKKAIVLDVCANIVLRLAIVFSDSESWFKLLVFIRSLLGSANSYMGLVLISEVASNRWRSRLSLIVASPRLIASVCMVPLAQSIPNSETFTIIACLYDVLLMCFLRWTPESPQWLLFNNKISQAENMLYTAAKKNRKRLCSDFKIRPVNNRDTITSLLYSFALAARIIAFAIILIITPRFFAINIRATLLGCCQAAGQLGAIVGYLVTTTKLMNTVAMALLGVVLTVILMILCLIFPDVDNREMPDVLQDMDYFCELSKPLRWATQKTHSPSREEVELRTHSFGSRGRALSSRSASLARAPAQPIGFTTLWRIVSNTVRRYCNALLCKNKK